MTSPEITFRNMTSPEITFKQLRIKWLLENPPVETERALEKARSLASAKGTKIGLIELYNGVCQEMGQLLVQTTLERNHINVADLEKQLMSAARLEGQHGDWTKPDPNQPLDFTDLSESALNHARNISKERRPHINPPEPSPSDLFRGIAKLVLNR